MTARIISSSTDCYQPRILTSYKEGRGDKGTSHIGKTKLPKISYGPPANQSELIRNHINKLIAESKLPSRSDFTTTLQWFADNTFSFGSFLYIHTTDTYTEGNEKHIFPSRFLEYMESQLFEWKSIVGDAKDFIVWRDEPYISIDNLRIMVRELETRYFHWRSDKEHESIEYVASVINRLSSYVFWGNRYLAHCNGVKEVYWNGSMATDFPL